MVRDGGADRPDRLRGRDQRRDDHAPECRRRVQGREEVVDRAWKSIPQEWIEGEEDALDRLLEQLFERRARVPALIESCRESRINPFPNWPVA